MGLRKRSRTQTLKDSVLIMAKNKGSFGSRKGKTSFKSETLIGRYVDGKTSTENVFDMLLAEDVTEDEWHEDDRADLRKALDEMPGASVKRRPDGTLTVLMAMDSF